MPTETTANRAYQLPHPDNELDTDVMRLISALQAIDADVASLLVSVSQAALAGHGHIISDVSGLQTALDAKAATGHTHAIDDLSDVDIAGAPAGRPLTTQPGGGVGIGPAPATQGDIDGAITSLVSSALGGDLDFASSMTVALNGKAPASHTHSAEDVSGLDAALGTARVPAGTVMPFASATPPTGWLVCNGAAVSRTTYADLFAVIGTTFGAGDGSTTFNLPDLRGEFVRGWDGGRGVDAGRVFGSWQDEAVGPHTHTIGDLAFNGRGISGGGLPNAEINDVTTQTISTGLNSGAETRPRNVALLYCIKAFDVVLDPTQVSAANVIADVASNTSSITDLAADMAAAAPEAKATGAVGTYAMLLLYPAGQTNPGDTRPGSDLRYANAYQYAGGTGYSPHTPAGTWRCMGNTEYVGGNASSGAGTRITLWLRIA